LIFGADAGILEITLEQYIQSDFSLTRVRELASWSTFGNLYLVIPEAVYSYVAVVFWFQSEGA
jgi:hypothetical protein